MCIAAATNDVNHCACSTIKVANPGRASSRTVNKQEAKANTANENCKHINKLKKKVCYFSNIKVKNKSFILIDSHSFNVFFANEPTNIAKALFGFIKDMKVLN